ncbi:MAG: hypothetical protein DRI93_03230 [Aquificota bacterium]|nr:MAG: hypothetical protein DRJ03_14805 [Chloroflexota bacterium]RLD94919.1 MAG: hypothetical protein DRI93_03230 [Aquificota bacterium]
MDYDIRHKVRIQINLGEVIGLAEQISRVDKRWAFVEEKARELLQAVRELMAMGVVEQDCGCS